MRTVVLLGATGSIGSSTLDVIARHPQRYRVGALAAHRNVDALLALCRRFRPPLAAVLDPRAARALRHAIAREALATRVVAGAEGLEEAATLPGADTVLAAIVGAAGLHPTLAAARAGKRILFANKEALIIGGAPFMRAAAQGGATLLPIDSEHNAIFQCLPPAYARDPHAAGVRRLILTASGGPFRTRALDTLADVTPDEACAHPNWRMGRKISVDSATMMNKGLEVIEAHRLFGVDASSIDVVVHPQSVVHSMVEFVDGAVMAELGHPDMRTPIAHALAHPERVDAGVPSLDLVARGALTFEAPDHARFPAIRLAYDALAAGEHAPIALNAANEVAVEAFLAGLASYGAIARTAAMVLDATPPMSIHTLDEALACDAAARRCARAMLRLPTEHQPSSLVA